MFCSECGKKIKNDSLFCPYCGADLRENDIDEENELEEILEDDKEQLEDDDILEKKQNRKQVDKLQKIYQQEWENGKKTAVKKAKEIRQQIKSSNQIGKRLKCMITVLVLLALLISVVVTGRSFLLGNKSENKLKTGFYIKKEDSVYRKNGEQLQSQISNENGVLQIVWDDYVNGSYYYVDEDGTLHYNTNFGKNSVKLDEDVTTLTEAKILLGTSHLWKEKCTKIQYMKQTGLEADTTTLYYSSNGLKPVRIRNAFGIAFSPNGKYMAYMKKDLGENRLYIIDLQSGQEEKIASFEGNGSVLEISDNRDVYYSLSEKDESGNTWHLWNSESKQDETLFQANTGYFDVVTGKILAVNSSGDLLYYNINNKEENIKIASNVQQYFIITKDDSSVIGDFYNEIDSEWEEVIYMKDTACYYKNLNNDKEAEKLMSGKEYIMNLQITGDRRRVFGITENGLYYTDKQKDGWSDKQKISSDVTWYKISDDGKEVVFMTIDGELKYWKDGKESRVLDEEVQSEMIQLKQEGVLYMDQDKALNYCPFSEKKEKVKLSDDVTKYVESDDTIYYLTDEATLYQTQLDGKKKEKVMDDVKDLITYQYE